MRLTVLDDDPGINVRPRRYKVLLDGVEVKRCLTADDERGEVIAGVRDEYGGMRRQTLYGKVVIERIR